ncbi:MAG: RT0821/Lpp0805 family surface protein [Alphaproteobacteria bacterium]
MKFKSIALAAALVLGLAACQSGPKQTGGTVLGGIAGGLLGSQVGGGKGKLIAVGAGALLGALVGSEVGKSLDNADRAAMQQSTQSTLETAPSGTTSSWRNPDSGNYGTITPQPAYQANDGQYCREFQQTVTVGGREESAYGTACRQPDGTWKVVSS